MFNANTLWLSERNIIFSVPQIFWPPSVFFLQNTTLSFAHSVSFLHSYFLLPNSYSTLIFVMLKFR